MLLLFSTQFADADPFRGDTRSVLNRVAVTSVKSGARVRLFFKGEAPVYAAPIGNGKPFILRLYRTESSVEPIIQQNGIQISTVAAGNTLEVAISSSQPLTARITRASGELHLALAGAAGAIAGAVPHFPNAGIVRRDARIVLRPRFFEQEAHTRFIREQRARPNDKLGYDSGQRTLLQVARAYKRHDKTSVDAVVVDLIAYGTTKASADPRTRVYEYTFNPRTGALMAFSVHSATPAQAQAARLPVSQIRGTH